MILRGRGRHWNAVPAAKKPRRSGAQVTNEVLRAHLPMGTPELYVAFDCVVISPKEGAAVRARPGLPRGEAQNPSDEQGGRRAQLGTPSMVGAGT